MDEHFCYTIDTVWQYRRREIVRWQTMNTLSFISDFCSSGELPVNSFDAQQLACFVRVRFYCGVWQGFAELGGFELCDGGTASSETAITVIGV